MIDPKTTIVATTCCTKDPAAAVGRSATLPPAAASSDGGVVEHDVARVRQRAQNGAGEDDVARAGVHTPLQPEPHWASRMTENGTNECLTFCNMLTH